MTWTLGIDLLAIILLLVTMGYAVAFNRKITDLYKNRHDLQGFLTNFSQSLQKAEEGMNLLRTKGEKAYTALNDQVAQAQTLKDDLNFLIQRAEKAANTLEESVRKSRQKPEKQGFAPSSHNVTSLKKHLTPTQETQGYDRVSEGDDLMASLKNIR